MTTSPDGGPALAEVQSQYPHHTRACPRETPECRRWTHHDIWHREVRLAGSYR